MNDVATPLLGNLMTASQIVYALLGVLGLLALAFDWLADGVFFRRIRLAFVRPNPFRGWLWLVILFVLTCSFELSFTAPTVYPNGVWNPQLFVLIFPESFRTAWLINMFEEVFRFGGFFLLIRFVRPAIAIFMTTLLFTLAHSYYHLSLHQALTSYTVVFISGTLFLFIGLRFGLLAVYAFHVAVNTFEFGAYFTAPSGWLWVNWVLALIIAVPLTYAFRQAGLGGLGKKVKTSEGEQLDREAVPVRL